MALQVSYFHWKYEISMKYFGKKSGQKLRNFSVNIQFLIKNEYS